MRSFVALSSAGAIALAVAVSVAYAASTMSMTAPATATEGGFFDVHVSGSTEEFGLRWKVFVQKGPCQQTVVAQEAQPGAVGQNDHAVQGGGVMGPYSFDSSLFTAVGGQKLTGVVTVCSYLFRFLGSDRSTLAMSSKNVTLLPPGTKPPVLGVRVPAVARMSASGAIRITATCPTSCNVKVSYRGPRSSAVTVQKHLRASNAAIGISLPLDRATRKLVLLARKKHKGVPVSVKASAKPPTGGAKTVSRTVTVK